MLSKNKALQMLDTIKLIENDCPSDFGLSDCYKCDLTKSCGEDCHTCWKLAICEEYGISED